MRTAILGSLQGSGGRKDRQWEDLGISGSGVRLAVQREIPAQHLGEGWQWHGTSGKMLFTSG